MEFYIYIYIYIYACLVSIFTERFATSRYREPTVANTSNVFMHLTNYSVNKHSRTYVVDNEAGSKRYVAADLSS
jgi:tubulin polyglutamylase TTLL6/13